jgi:VCBS repeat-containing protein
LISSGFGPWGGSIVFNSDIDWDFESNPPRNLIIHEFFHVLGFSNGNQFFNRWIDDSDLTFTGPEATAEYDGSGNPPINDIGIDGKDFSHWGDITDEGQGPLMRVSGGTLTALDLAALKDIGWEVVEASDNSPPTATADQGINFTTNEGIILNINAANGVLANDTDPEEEPLIVNAVEGEEDNVGTEIELASGALLTLNADGSYNYDPNRAFEELNEGETDTDSFTYTVSDGNGGTDTATVEITINGVTDNQAPILEQELTFILNPNEPENFNGSVETTDPEGAEVNFTITQGNEDGDDDDQDPPFAINNDGVITVADADELPEQGVFNLRVQATDTSEEQLSSTADVTINVTAGNLDIGGNGEVDQSDALLLQAQLFGTPGLIQAVSEDFNRSAPGTVTRSPDEIEQLIQDNSTVFEISGNGEMEQSDALLLQAQLFGTSGLIQAVSDDFNRAAPGTVTRTPKEIEQLIEAISTSA